MNFRFTIGKKIASGFGILIILTLIVFITTYITLEQSRTTNDRISNVNTPSVKALQELKFDILESKLFLESWMRIEKAHADKDKLLKFRNKQYPKVKVELTRLSSYWPSEQRDSLSKLFEEISVLFDMQAEEIIGPLQAFSDYDDMNKMIAEFALEEGGNVHVQTGAVLDHLEVLIKKQKEVSNTANESMYAQFDTLKGLVIWLGFALVVISFIVAIITTKNIVDPIYRLKTVLVKLGRGVFPDKPTSAGNDEIGEMTVAMNNVVDGLKRTKDFAQEVGSGNFDTDYKPLSSKDSLGKALLTMRDDLAENERFLEEKVRQRTAEVVKQKEEIDQQKEQLEEYFLQVTDSIKYAQKIQEAILPPESYVRKLLPDSFIFYRPKDIVSGDFYWLGEAEDRVYFAAVDCTGHGVPGAFMSIVGYNQLKQAIITTNGGSPAEILDHLNIGVSETLHQKDENSTSKDGMDVAICSLNHKTKELQYAGAFNPLYLLRDGNIVQTKGDKFPIGSFLDGATPNFTNHKLQLLEGDILYIFSDGYADQFGGPRGKKMMYKKFRDTLIANSKKDLSVQKELLRDYLYDWMGEEEQVDDILVVGVKV
ncbi:SpoIIE family protein phosphatase [Vicingaceae bacterium]|nr:SpoIIE family protein phosphatase [Vicingaceae bacterium]MDB4061291.1 SpoIIE family protein phosphatase [Vicingaceae bacterium]MDB4083149.1 SpoIIE family protein phosphatase [Vicingaceae bacterium]MDC0005025.1 SpoIIE family protein phosphatase [bacterium]MDC1451905.1 SpoIIE family protein phosphatase [Vicingaceae bacterium]